MSCIFILFFATSIQFPLWMYTHVPLSEEQREYTVYKIWKAHDLMAQKHSSSYAQYLHLERAFCEQNAALCNSTIYHIGRARVCLKSPIRCKNPADWEP